MKQKVTTDKTPSAPFFSQAIISNGFVFVAGQIHSTPENKLVGETVEEKLKQIFFNISEVLKAADLNLDNVVKATVYVTDMSQMPELNKFYPTYFNEPFPAREAVCVKELPLGATIEISVIAEKA